jgi:lipoprotein NlpI
MTVADSARRPPPVGMVITLFLAGFPYAAMLACLFDLHRGGNDAMGRGLDEAFALVLGIVLWLLLGILLLIGWLRGAMPDWSVITAATLWPLSAVSAAIALDFIDRDGSYMIVPAMLPPAIAAYALWARLTRLHWLLQPLPTSVVAWIVVALVAAMPLPRYFMERHAKHVVAQQEAAEAERQAAIEAEKQRLNLQRFEKLTSDSPLWDYAAFFAKDNPLSDRAIAAARALPHRQVDAEEALRRDIGFPLVEYERLDLTATPALCSAASDFLHQEAAAHRAPTPDTEYETTFPPTVEADDISVIEWLTESCDIDDAVAQIRGTIETYKPTSSRDAALALLAWRRGNGFYQHGRHDPERALQEYNEALHLRPENEQFRKYRGDVYFDLKRYDDAIADYDEAVRVNPGYSEAFYSRANAYVGKGADEKALASFDEAIRIAPEFAAAHNNRGLIYIREGKLDLAFADFDTAAQHAPKFRLALDNRARVRFFQGDYAGAVGDFAAALKLKPDEPYTVMLLYLSQLHAGQDARAPLKDNAAALDRTTWPYPIVAAWLGDSDAQTVQADAAGDTNPDRVGQSCEADFYFGDAAFTAGDAATARGLLERAIARCPSDYLEVTLAKYELPRLP